MATISCKCGARFSDGAIPCPHQWLLISDMNYESAIEEVIRVVEAGEDRALAHYAPWAAGMTCYMCPECNRLLVFKDGLDKPAASYKPE